MTQADIFRDYMNLAWNANHADANANAVATALGGRATMRHPPDNNGPDFDWLFPDGSTAVTGDDGNAVIG